MFQYSYSWRGKILTDWNSFMFINSLLVLLLFDQKHWYEDQFWGCSVNTFPINNKYRNFWSTHIKFKPWWHHQGHFGFGLEATKFVTESPIGMWRKSWVSRHKGTNEKIISSCILGIVGSSVLGTWPILEISWPLQHRFWPFFFLF